MILRKWQQVEQDVKDEGKIIEQEGGERAKVEDNVSATRVPLAEPEEKVEEKQSEPPIVKEDVKAEEEEKPKAEDLPSLPITSDEATEKVEDKHIEPPATEEIKKPDDISVLDVSSVDTQDSVKDSVPEIKELQTPQEEPATGSKMEEKLEEQPKEIDNIPELAATEVAEEKVDQVEEPPKKIDTPESVSDAVETKPEQVEEVSTKVDTPGAVTEAVEAKEEQVSEKTDVPEAANETIEKKEEQVEELKKEIGVPESASEVVEAKEEKVEELPPKVQEASVAEDVEVSAGEQKNEEVLAPVPKAEDVPEAKEQIEKEPVVVKPEEKTEVEAIKEKEIPSDEIIDTKSVEGVEALKAESTATESKDAQVNTGILEIPPAELAEKTQDKEKELPAKPKSQGTLGELLEKNEKDIEAEDLMAEEKEEKRSIVEETTQPEATTTHAVTDSIPTSEDPGKVLEEETTSRDIELPADIGSKIDETVAPAETQKDAEVEKKVDVEEPQKPETESKPEEAVEGRKEPETSDTPVEEESREVNDLKTTEEAPKEEVPVKTKQSNNLLSKMKHSLVKAKKAIIGKSPSKTPPSVTKDDAKS